MVFTVKHVITRTSYNFIVNTRKLNFHVHVVLPTKDPEGIANTVGPNPTAQGSIPFA